MKIQTRYSGYNYATFSEYYEGKHGYQEHIHQFLEVHCVLEGETVITVGGAAQVARAGDLVVIFPFQSHSQYTPDYCKIWVGLASISYVNDLLSRDHFCVPDKNVFTPCPTAFAYIKERLPSPHWIKRPSSLTKIRFRITKALYFVILDEFLRQVKITSTSINTTALAATYMYVNEHYRESNLTLKKLATAIGYTPNYLSSCLSSIPNANFRDILNSARVDYAKKQLTSTDKRILDIALESGFSSEAVFYGIFEKFVGMTPRQYRLAKRNT